MAEEPLQLFWDSCIFDAYLYDQSALYDVLSIGQYLEDAKRNPPLCVIYTSSVVFVEVLSSKIKRPAVGSMLDFVNDFVGQIIVIDATVNVMHLAGQLRDIPYKKAPSESRVLSTGDSIMLASCLYLEEAYGVRIDEFHTFDAGKKRKTVPLLSYDEWCEGLSADEEALTKRVRGLKRKIPKHPAPPLFSTPRQNP